MTKALSLLLAATVALVVTPAAAKTAKYSKHKRAHVVHVARQAAPAYRGADKFRAGPLYWNGGTYMGDDPDPFIRSQLWRDVGGRFGGDAN